MRRFEFVTLGSGPVADPGPAGQIISLELLGNTSSFPQKSPCIQKHMRNVEGRNVGNENSEINLQNKYNIIITSYCISCLTK